MKIINFPGELTDISAKSRSTAIQASILTPPPFKDFSNYFCYAYVRSIIYMACIDCKIVKYKTSIVCDVGCHSHCLLKSDDFQPKPKNPQIFEEASTC